MEQAFRLRKSYQPVLLMALVFLIYVALAIASSAFLLEPNGVSFFWPCSGLALGLLLLGGRRFLPVILTSEVIGSLWAGDSVLLSVMFGLAICTEAVVCDFLLRHKLTFSVSMSTPRDLISLTLAASVGALVSAGIALISLVIDGTLDGEGWLGSAFHWWQGDVLGIFLITPALLIWRNPPGWKKSIVWEMTALMMLTLMMSGVVFLGIWKEQLGYFAKAFLLFIPLVWAATRSFRHGVVLVVLLVTLVGLVSALRAIGYFGQDVEFHSLHNYWLFMITFAWTGLLLGLSVENSIGALRKQKKSEFMLNTFLQSNLALSWVKDAGGRYLYINDAYEKNFGASRKNFIGMTDVDIFTPEVAERLRNSDLQAVALGHTLEFQETTISPDGNVLHWLVIKTPFRDEEGNWLVGGSAIDISERVRNEQALHDSQARIKHYLREKMSIQENERRHLARELHDELGQLLSALKLELLAHERILRKMNISTEGIPRVLNLLNQSIDTIRNITTSLRPKVLDMGLEVGIHWLVDFFQLSAGIATVLDMHLEGKEIPEEVQTGAFRILQEALTNIARHAGATRVDIHVIVESGRLRVQIEDNGRGFDPKAYHQGLGLTGMYERAESLGGHLEISSAAGDGVRIVAWLPL